MTQTIELPKEIESESAFLGSVILSGDGDLLELVDSNDFLGESHRWIYLALRQLKKVGQPIDVVAISNTIKKLGKTEEVSPTCLDDVMASVGHPGHCEYYASVIRESSMRRQLLFAAGDASKSASDPTSDIDDTIGKLAGSLDAILERRAGSESISVVDAVQSMLDSIETGKSAASPTGYEGLDRLLDGGLRPGQLVVIAARPGCGKTALAVNLGLSMARLGTAVEFVSLEMDRAELAARLMSLISGIDCSKIQANKINEYEKSALYEACNQLHELPFSICDSPTKTVAEIGALARVAKRKRGLGMLVVDYLGLIRSEDKKATKNDQIAAISRSLKVMAKELHVPVVVCAQLNRESERREDKVPRLSDLRDSGAIEQDADIVVFPHRESDELDDRTNAHLIVSKHRNGRTGKVPVSWIPGRMSFT